MLRVPRNLSTMELKLFNCTTRAVRIGAKRVRMVGKEGTKVQEGSTRILRERSSCVGGDGVHALTLTLR